MNILKVLGAVSAVTQPAAVSKVAVQPAKGTEDQSPAPSQLVFTPVKLLSNVFLDLNLLGQNQNGPVITNDAGPIYRDRFDSKKNWYYPEFILQQPLQNSFRLACHTGAPDANGDPTYAGEATFNLKKTVPAEVDAQKGNNPSAKFTEITLNDLTFSFNIRLADGQISAFPCTFVQNDSDFTLTLKLDRQEGLVRFFKFLSNPANKEFCYLQINASYFGYTAKPIDQNFAPVKQQFRDTHRQTTNRVMLSANFATTSAMRVSPQLNDTVKLADDPDDYVTNAAMPFSKTIGGVNFDCHTFPSNYVTRAPDNTVGIFACKPPFGDSSLAKNEYSKFHLIKGSLAGTGVSAVYINLYSGNYLVIPERYQIALEETDGGALIPAVYLFTTIDVTNIGNSTATFKFSIAPDVSDFQVLLLKKLLMQNIPISLNKTLADIFIEFPTKIHQPELVQFNKDQIPNIEIAAGGVYSHGAGSSNYFRLEFQNVNIGNANAASIASMLKHSEGKMIETIMFGVDSDTDATPQSSIVLSLGSITGKGLEIQKSTTDNSVFLINKTLMPISAARLADKDDDPKNLEPAVVINANQAITTTAITDVTEIGSTEFEYNYLPGQDYLDRILKEIRTDAQQVVQDDIIVTNNTGLFALFKINHIDFVMSIVNPDDPDPAHALHSTNLISLATDGAVTFISFVLPVAKYLSKWSVVYSTVIHFTDNTSQPNDPQLIADINSVGKTINLTVSNLKLHKP